MTIPVEVIRQVHAGKKQVPPQIAAVLAEHLTDEALTDREVDILKHVAGGNRNKDIADKLYITEETVKVHVKHIMEKFGQKIAPRPLRSLCAEASFSYSLSNIICVPSPYHDLGSLVFTLSSSHKTFFVVMRERNLFDIVPFKGF